jgi:sugar/nucleoside kinase (ribokinase family)
MNFLVIGDANADLSAPLRAFPREGDDTALLGLAWGSGGAGVNVATAIALLGGARARLLTRVGVDPSARVSLDAAWRAGVDLTFLQRDPALATGLCFAAVSPGGERTFFSYRGANAALSLPDRDALFHGIEHLHVCGHALLEGAQRDTTLALIDEAARRAVPISLDLCLPLCRTAADLVLTLAPKLALLTGNADEITLLAPASPDDDVDDEGETLLDAAITALERREVARIIVKLGADGAACIEHGTRKRVPAFDVEAIDTTAAGDAHVAAVLVALGNGGALDDALVAGNAVGAITTTRLGAADALPTNGEFHAFLQAYRLALAAARELSPPSSPPSERA